MENIYDLIIVGGGPAGITAAIYANRAMLNFLFFEKAFAGGQIINTYEIDNYPGIKNISGFELSNLFMEHATSLGVQMTNEEVTEIIPGDVHKVVTSSGTYYAKTIILSTGAESRKLGAEGELKYASRGVSYCATCDGAFYRGKKTAVIGGGDVAVEDAIYLSRMCEKVYLIHRRNELRALKTLQDKLFKLPNVEVVWDTEVSEIYGNEFVEGIRVFNNKTGEKSEIAVDGVFVAVGTTPNSSLLKGIVDMDESGWIITNEDCETTVTGIFAAGDVRSKNLRQIITGAADGAIAASACQKYL